MCVQRGSVDDMVCIPLKVPPEGFIALFSTFVSVFSTAGAVLKRAVISLIVVFVLNSSFGSKIPP